MTTVTEPTALENWIWERDGVTPDLKLFMLALLKTGDPRAANEIAGLKPGQAKLFQDILVASGWATNGDGGLMLTLPQSSNGASPESRDPAL